MYFDKDVVKIEDLIKQPERYFAHKPKKDDRKKETLKEHTNLAEAYFLRIFEERNWGTAWKFLKKNILIISPGKRRIFFGV